MKTVYALMLVISSCLMADAFRPFGANRVRPSNIPDFYYSPYSLTYTYPSNYYYKRDIAGESMNKTINCVFKENELVCKNHVTEIECDAVEVMDSITTPIPDFFIGSVPVGDGEKDIESVRYPMYFPTSKDTWNSTFVDGSSSFTFSLFYSPKESEHGVRIKDLDCWRNLTSVLKIQTDFDTIKVDSNEVHILGTIKRVRD